MSFKDPNHGIGGSEGTIHDGGGVMYPGGNPNWPIGEIGHGDGGSDGGGVWHGPAYPGGNPYPGWPESPPGEPGHGDGGWHEPYNDHCWDYNDHCWDYNDYYYNCEYTDYCYEPTTYEFDCSW